MTKRDPHYDWTPRRYRGGIFCAPACGHGCTLEEHNKAVKAAQALVKRMGPAWKPNVSENLGWHWEIVNGKASIRFYAKRGKFPAHYTCCVTDLAGVGYIGTEAKTPEVALALALDQMRAIARRLGDATSELMKRQPAMFPRSAETLRKLRKVERLNAR